MGTPFGKYILHERIGAGGMAEVFRATLPGAGGIDKDCVLKRVHSQIADDGEAVRMFLEEARISISLQHGNIVPVFDFGEVNGAYYLAMEHVTGKDLSGILSRMRKNGEAFPVELAALIAVEVAKGLAYAHGKADAKGRPLGLVHRDVSPSNVLVSFDGDVRLVDFGIAKAQSRAIRTESHVLKGKIPYMSPEQARGEPVDRSSDIWSLGVMLYEMVTGRRPIEGRDALHTLELVRASRFEPLDQIRTDLPPELVGTVVRAMSAGRADRIQDAREVQVTLTRVLAQSWPAVTSADLAQFVRSLFPDEVARASRPSMPPVAVASTVPSPFERDLLDAAGAAGSSAPAVTAPTQLDRPGAGPVPPAAAPESRARPTAEPETSMVSARTIPPRLATTRRTLAGSIAAFLIALAALGAWLSSGRTPARTAHPTGEVRRLPEATGGTGAQHAPARTDGATAAPAVSKGERTAIALGTVRDATAGWTSAADASASPEPSQRARARLGVLLVHPTPWAEVYVDGRRRAASTPATVRLTVGDHTVRLINPESGASQTFQIAIAEGETVRLTPQLPGSR